jgi:hypothetical protein
MEQHYTKSSFREKLIEHLFIGELLKLSWLDGDCSVSIATPEVDNQGYDLIAEQGSVLRHIQLKTSHHNALATKQKVHVALAKKPSGCIVWLNFDAETMQLGPYLFFGDLPGKPLPNIDGLKTAKHTKANAQGVKAERPDIREIPKSKFTKFESIRELSIALFGHYEAGINH